ncbi:MAG: hypothetical protein GC145_02635 [Caulobacter sp.]|nr:hypothetical protein [Caulobacter sp.]
MSKASPPIHGLGLVAIVASMICLAAPAMAQDQQSVDIVGDAGIRCSLGQPTQGSGALTNFDTPSGSVFSITDLADPTTLSTKAANITLSLDAMCNTLHRVGIASDNNGLWRVGVGGTTGFGDAVPYQANLVWADQQYLLTVDASSRQPVEQQVLINRPNTGEMLIEIEINAGATNAGIGTPLLAGEYSDILRITVEAQ